jgi:hypothetical protein
MELIHVPEAPKYVTTPFPQMSLVNLPQIPLISASLNNSHASDADVVIIFSSKTCLPSRIALRATLK